jgi:PmbA protein
MREVESLKESGSRAAGLRILIGKNTGSAYTSELSPEGIRQMVAAAIELAKITTADPHAGLPDAGELGAIPGDLRLYSEDIAQLETPRKIELAREAEAAALDADPRISNSEGGSFDTHLGRNIFAIRAGSGQYRTSYCSLAAVPIARRRIHGTRPLGLDVAPLCRSMPGIGRIAAMALCAAGRKKVETSACR